MKPALVLCLLLILVLPCGFVQAQDFTLSPAFAKANSHWIIGTVDTTGSAGIDIDFNSGAPVIAGTGTGILDGWNTAAVSDTGTGQLLFYTNTLQCWNRNHQVMPNGDSLAGAGTGGGISGGHANQGSCIVPVIDSPGKYYVFTLTAHKLGSVPAPLHYSVVDMTLDSGLGDIMPGRKNILLDEGPLHEGMIAVPGNNCDIWLVVHAYYNSVFKAYHITREGIDTIPVLSTAGPALSSNSLPAYELGGMAISPDRSTIAVGTYSFAACTLLSLTLPSFGATVARFDPGSGQVSNWIKVNDSMAVFSLCFSPDNSKLYIQGILNDTSFNPPAGTLGQSQIRQYDLTSYNAVAIAASEQVVYSVPTGQPAQFTHMRRRNDTIFTDWMAYASPAGDVYPTYISAPSQPGAACNLHYDLYVASGLEATSNTGNDVVYPFPPDTLFNRAPDTVICIKDKLVLQAGPGFAGYEWDNGSSNAARDIRDTGTYWVFCKDDCHPRIDTFHVGLKAYVPVALGNDTLVCNAATLELHPVVSIAGTTFLWPDGSTGNSYLADSSGTYWLVAGRMGCTDTGYITVTFRDLRQDLGADLQLCKGDVINMTLNAVAPQGVTVLWNTGSNTPALTVTDTGTYWVRVSQAPCSGSDSIRISRQSCSCYFDLPTAFTPNGDGLNDIFLPFVEPQCPVKNVAFNIFNRWGQRVFSGHNMDQGWDGTWQGQPAEAGTYHYELRFKGGTREIEYHKKGNLTLIR